MGPLTTCNNHSSAIPDWTSLGIQCVHQGTWTIWLDSSQSLLDLVSNNFVIGS